MLLRVTSGENTFNLLSSDWSWVVAQDIFFCFLTLAFCTAALHLVVLRHYRLVILPAERQLPYLDASSLIHHCDSEQSALLNMSYSKERNSHLHYSTSTYFNLKWPLSVCILSGHHWFEIWGRLLRYNTSASLSNYFLA